MRLARVRGTVVSTIKHPTYLGHKLLICQPLAPQGGRAGPPVLAVDRVQAGAGDLVLLMSEGNGVRQLLGANAGPIRTLIVGIVDEVQLGR